MRTTLKEQTETRLAAAGFTPDDPAIMAIRTYNEAIMERAVAAAKDGDTCGSWRACPQHGSAMGRHLGRGRK